MADFYQIPLDIPRTSPEYLRWEKLNFILRQIFNRIGNLDGREGPVDFLNTIDMGGNQISNGPIMSRARDTDYVTKSWFRSAEFGRLAVGLLSSGGKTPLPITGSLGTPAEGGGGTSDHASLSNLSYPVSGHTGFVPATRSVATTAPLTGGGALSGDLTLSIPAATGSVDGYLTATDWTTFNAKQSALSFGDLTETISAVLTIVGGTGAVVGSGASIQVKEAGASQGGYLSAAHWLAFATKIGGGGTAGVIPKFTASAAVGDSVIREDSGKIGIGTAGAASYTLEVLGRIKASDGSILPTVKTLTISGGAIATDATLGNHFRGTVNSDFVLSNPTGAVDGQRIVWEFKQDATGGRKITLGSKFVVPVNMPEVILTGSPNAYDMVAVLYNASTDKFVVTGLMKEYS